MAEKEKENKIRNRNIPITEFMNGKAETIPTDFSESVDTAIIAIARGLWHKISNLNGDNRYVEFTLIELLRYGGCKEYGLAKNGECAITVGLVNHARDVLNALAKYRYLEKIPSIVSLYAIPEKSELWKILRRAKSPVDLITFIREVVGNA